MRVLIASVKRFKCIQKKLTRVISFIHRFSGRNRSFMDTITMIRFAFIFITLTVLLSQNRPTSITAVYEQSFKKSDWQANACII